MLTADFIRGQKTCKFCSRVYKRGALKSLYGITIDDFDRMLSEQGDVCAVCKQGCGTCKKLSVDHDHSTGAVRGLLCLGCNQKLGWFERNESRVLQYLSRAGTRR